MRQIRPHIGRHPKYSEDEEVQRAMEDAVDAMTASILELVATVTHKRLTQFAQILAESKNKDTK